MSRVNTQHSIYSLIPIQFILIAFFLSGCAASKETQNRTLSKSEVESLTVQRKAGEEYVIQPGDQIELKVWGYKEFNTKGKVNSRGIFTIPMAGEIKAEGLSKEKFKSNVRTKLTDYIKGEVKFTVTFTSAQRNMVSVLGSVGQPSNYQVINNTSLFEILSEAGGTTEQADLRRIRIYEKGNINKATEVNLADYLKEEDTGPVAVVKPGDIVYVPKQENMMEELSSLFRDVVLLFGMFRVFN